MMLKFLPFGACFMAARSMLGTVLLAWEHIGTPLCFFDASIIVEFCAFISLEYVKCRIIFGHQKRVCPEWTVRICT